MIRFTPSTLIRRALPALLVLTCAWLVPAQAQPAYLDLDKLFGDMRAFCMGDVCAGMSIDDLGRVDGGRLQLDRPLAEDKLCNSRQQQNVNGTFKAKDGTLFDVAFYMFPGRGAAKDVFRVVLVGLTLHGVGKGEFHKLAMSLVDRYKLTQGWLDFGPTWYGQRPMLEISLRAEQFAEPNELVSQMKLTVAPVGAFAQTANEPWCLGTPTPPLPAPPPSLPKL